LSIPESIQSLLRQFSEMGTDGTFGAEAQSASAEYEELPSGMHAAAKYLAEFYTDTDETQQHRDYLVQILLVAYRDAKKKDPQVAWSFASAFIEDYPGMPGTALLPRWTNLTESCMGFKAVADSQNRSLVWQQSSRLVLALNEFLDGLLGMLILTWRCATNRSVNPNVLYNAYGAKVNEFNELTNGEEGAFYLFFRIAMPKLRNGLSHGSAWLDSENGLVRYSEGGRNRTEHEIDIVEFMARVKLGCDLAKAYIAALAAIVLLESSEYSAVSGIREQLVTLWRK